MPEPKFGQKEWDLFTKMYGTRWDEYDDLKFDKEDKITEFNYENYIPQHLYNKNQTIEVEFKDEVKYLNLLTKTKYEKHKVNQEEFKKLMPVFATLTEDEAEILIHMIQNKRTRELNNEKRRRGTLIDDACSDAMKTRLARMSEDENFALKNAWYHNKKTMKFADKKKMPIDQRKVVDMLRHQNIFKHKIVSELDTYFEFQNNPQFENGVLTYVNEASWGDLKELLLDVGISRHNTPYTNVAELQKIHGNYLSQDDKHGFQTLANSRFTMLDMTDYETDFASYSELPEFSVGNLGAIDGKQISSWPMTHAQVEVNEIEALRPNTTGRSHREALEARAAEAEEEEEEEDEDEDEDEEDEDEEGGEGDEDEAEEEEAAEEEEDPEPEDELAVPDEIVETHKQEDKYFRHNETLRGKYNVVELDQFMKILNVKPVPQW